MYRPHRTWQPIALSHRSPNWNAVPRTGRLVLAEEDRPAVCARRHARKLLSGWSLADDLVEDALLIVSELVTNAEQHAANAGGPQEIRVATHAGRLTLAVSDREPHPPTSVVSDYKAECGRGLAIVSALAEAYGCFITPMGKIVWVELTASTVLPEVMNQGLVAV
jgi:anti-sigma regulatory factor (Ser/Thr protein kinase)